MAQLARDEAGNVWEIDAQGNPVRLVQPAGGPSPIAPPNPSQQFEPVKAQADARRAQADAALAEATAPYAGDIARAEVTKALAEAEKARTEAGRTQEPLTAKARVDAEQALTDAQALVDLAGQLRQKYYAGPGATKGVYGFGDYFPTAENKTFNDLSQQARGLVKRALGFTGGEGNTAAESSALYDPFLPRAGDLDDQILQKIGALEDLAKRSATMSSSLLGRPLPAFAGGEQASGDTPNAMDQIYIAQGAGTQRGMPDLAPVGQQTIRNMRDIPPEANYEIDQLRARMLAEGGGRLDPAKYAAEANAITQKYGFSTNALDFATKLNEYLDQGGRTIPSGFLPPERLATASETARNNLLNNPLSAAAIGGANTLSAGMVEALAPDEMMALRDAQGGPVLAGEIVGAIGGTQALARGTTGALGALGRVAGRPNLAQSIASRVPGGQFGRNVLTDTAYGAAYGQNTQGDPLTGAAFGAGGSTLGQGIGRGIGAGIGGLRRTPEAQALRDRGVPVSVARQIGAGRAEDLAQSIPVVGDMSRARQLDSFMGVEQQALREVGEPIGYVPQAGGRQGLQEMLSQPGQPPAAIGRAYDDAVANQSFTPDDIFNQSVDDAYAAAQRLPPDLAQRATLALDNRLAPLRGSPRITGEEFQQARRGLKSYRAETTKPGFEGDYRNVITRGMTALDDLVSRQGSPEVIAKLGRADQAHRAAKTLESAMKKAAGGSQSGEIFLPTPYQLQTAGMQTQSRFPGPRPFEDLADNAQAVLPSRVPNSGTTDRALAASLLGYTGLGATAGGGIGYTADDPAGGASTGALTLGGGAAILAALGTRRGQAALERILISRPQALQTAGQGFRRRAGLFGSTGGYLVQPGPDTIQVAPNQY